MRSDSTTQTDYWPQLDGVRALAIIAVLLAHFPPHPIVNEAAHLGRLGVTLFFVLSGFLITGILLRSRDEQSDGGASRWSVVRAFYVRRILRIFPIYYLTIVFLALIDFGRIRKDVLWHLTYSSNVSGAFFNGHFPYSGHLWSLCVEEQFYLIWPFVVLFCPKRHLHRIILVVIACSVSYRFLGSWTVLQWRTLIRPLFGCMDSLGLGALLALYWNDKGRFEQHISRLRYAGLFVGLPTLLYLQYVRATSAFSFKSLVSYITWTDFVAALTFVCLIAQAARNESGVWGNFLACRLLRYIGKISYGIYLYHVFLLHGLPKILGSIGIPNAPPGLAKSSVYFAISITVAAVSWHLVERPVNDLKKRFPYATTQTSPRLGNG